MKYADKIIWKDRKHFMWFPWSFTKYGVSEERLLTEKGLTKTEYDEIYLYRVLDVKLERSLMQKFFGTGTIILYTQDANQAKMEIVNIKNPIKVKEMISKMSKEERRKNRVLEYSGSSIDFTDEDGNGIPDFVERNMR